jgi:hypothetical protein
VHHSVVPLLGTGHFVGHLFDGLDARWVQFSVASGRWGQLASLARMPGVSTFGLLRDRFGPDDHERLLGIARGEWYRSVLPKVREVEGARLENRLDADRLVVSSPADLHRHLVEAVGIDLTSADPQAPDEVVDLDSLLAVEVAVAVEALVPMADLPEQPPVIRTLTDAHRYLVALQART